VTHLGQQLSAWIDGELSTAERQRVVMHLSKCQSCKSEAHELTKLKRQMTALGAAAADAGLTGRLMELAGVTDGWRDGHQPFGSLPWPTEPGPLESASRTRRAEPRSGRNLVAGSFAVFLAGLGTAAFIASGGSDAPAPRVTPAVDVYMVQHPVMTGMHRRTSYSGRQQFSSGP
jgi:hypothetical protein